MINKIFKPISFCGGVNSANLLALKVIKQFKNTKKVYLLGKLVNNIDVCNKLSNEGIVTLDIEPNQYKNAIQNIIENDSVVIFSAHGHDSSLNQLLIDKNVIIYDTTCSKIKETLLKIKKIHDEFDSPICIVGKENHPETVVLLKSYSSNIFYNIKTKEFKKLNSSKLVTFAQSTISIEEYQNAISQLKKYYKRVEVIDTLCSVTHIREDLITKVDDSFDLILVVGSKKSSNTTSLYNRAVEFYKANKKVLMIDNLESLKRIDIKSHKKVAIFSGTSTMMESILAISNYLSSLK